MLTYKDAVIEDLEQIIETFEFLKRGGDRKQSIPTHKIETALMLLKQVVTYLKGEQ